MPLDDFLPDKNDWLSRLTGKDEKPDITKLDINEIKACGKFTTFGKGSRILQEGLLNQRYLLRSNSFYT